MIAGAGTGKTTALTERIVFLVEKQRIDPKMIVATTFTHKATAELYERTFNLLGERALQLRISTIDALIWNLALETMHQDLMPSAQLVGEASQRALLFDCAWEVIGKKRCISRSSWATSANNSGLVGLLEEATRAEITSSRDKKSIKKLIKKRLNGLNNRFNFGFYFQIPTLHDLEHTAKRYFERLKELSATDYNLLSRDFLRCLKQNKKLVRQFSSRINTILVDEFQDTSRIQAEILLLLSNKGKKIWAVGDPCQQIYEWRGAGPDNMLWLIRKTKAKKYYLTENRRSTQIILDCAYKFLSKRVTSLKRGGMLKRLASIRDASPSQSDRHPVYTGTLEQAISFAGQILKMSSSVKPNDIAILSRKLNGRTVKEIEGKAAGCGLKVQFHSSRADRAMEQTIGSPPDWKPGNVLRNLYKHRIIRKLVSRSLRVNDFTNLRAIRSIAAAADALDSTLPPDALTFGEAWPALKTTQNREISVSSAVVNRSDAIQVMTIHAAKGLEFPIVLLMKLGKGGSRSFPNPKVPEECRLAYVGATRARDILILVHTVQKPKDTLRAFGNELVSIRSRRSLKVHRAIDAPTILPPPPIIAATHLDLYEQCPLKFAAYHEGQFLPEWSVPQSAGARLHKALEYYLRAGLPSGKAEIDDCFKRGFQHGDSPIRKLPRSNVTKMKQSYEGMIRTLSKATHKPLAVEQRYRYMQGQDGQIDGIVDALIEYRDGTTVLEEWKSSTEIASDKRRAYTLQASAGALGIAAQNSYSIHLVDIVPVSAPSKTISLRFDNAFIEETRGKLDHIFRDLRDRKFKPRKGSHCKSCQLKPQCPIWRKR